MDHFLEEAVQKRNRGLDEILYFVNWGLMIGCGVLAYMSLLMLFQGFNLVSLIFTAVLVGLTVYMWIQRDKFRTEYEYTFTNGSLDFAMVFNNKRRKPLGSLNIQKVDAFGKVQSGSFRRHTAANDVKHLRWFLNRDAELYYIAFSKEGKKSVIVFEPSEEMVGYIKRYLPFGAYQEN